MFPFISWADEVWLSTDWIGLIVELAWPMGEGAEGISGGEIAGKTVDWDTVDSGKVMGGAIPGVIVGGLVRSGEDALGTESKNVNHIYGKQII